MKKIILATLLCCGLMSGYAQDVKLEGTWVLDSIELYKIVENDSILVDNGDFTPIRTSGAFDTISFEGNMVTVNIDDYITKAPFGIKNKHLSLYVSSIPMEYNLIENDKHLVLTRNFQDSHNDEFASFIAILRYKYIQTILK